MGFLTIFISSAVLSALSISNLGLISSMVGFLLDQKHNVHTYQINWSPPVQLVVEPKHLWVDQGHTSNGVAGYGFFLGLFGLYVAWRQRKIKGRTSKTLTALFVLQFLAVLFTLSAIIFVFLVTNETKGQHISETVARSNVKYPADKWTPETWFKAVLDLPLADQNQRHNINSNVTNMVAWRWMLIPIFLADIVAFSCTTMEFLKQKKDHHLGDAEQKVGLMPFKNSYMSPEPSPRLDDSYTRPYADSPRRPSHRRFESGA